MTDGFKVPGDYQGRSDFRCDTGTVVDEGTGSVVSSLVVYSHSGVSALLYEQSDVHPSRVVPLGSSSSSPTPMLYFSASIRIFFVCYFWCLKKQRWTEKVFASPRSVWRDQHLEQSGSLWRRSGEHVDIVNKQSTNHRCFKISHRKKERKKHQGVSLSDIVFIERKNTSVTTTSAKNKYLEPGLSVTEDCESLETACIPLESCSQATCCQHSDGFSSDCWLLSDTQTGPVVNEGLCQQQRRETLEEHRPDKVLCNILVRKKIISGIRTFQLYIVHMNHFNNKISCKHRSTPKHWYDWIPT